MSAITVTQHAPNRAQMATEQTARSQFQGDFEDAQAGVMREVSQNPTVSRNQNDISVLRKRSFAQKMGLGVENQAILVAHAVAKFK